MLSAGPHRELDYLQLLSSLSVNKRPTMPVLFFSPFPPFFFLPFFSHPGYPPLSYVVLIPELSALYFFCFSQDTPDTQTPFLLKLSFF
jgi:hypothetical protein